MGIFRAATASKRFQSGYVISGQSLSTVALVLIVLIVLLLIRSVEQTGLRLRRKLVPSKISGERRMLSAIRPAIRLRSGGILGEPVAPVIVLMVGVTPGPEPSRPVDCGQFVKLNPEIGISDRTVLLPPPTAFPMGDPQRDPLPYVLRIGRNFDFAGFVESNKALDCRHKFHSIVSCMRIVAEEFLPRHAESQNACPSSRTRIPPA